jgi:hypothetical protein
MLNASSPRPDGPLCARSTREEPEEEEGTLGCSPVPAWALSPEALRPSCTIRSVYCCSVLIWYRWL